MNMKDNIKNKRILLFCTPFFSYYKKIEEVLYEEGALNVETIVIPYFKECCRYGNSKLRASFFFLFNPFYRVKWEARVLNNIEFENFDTMLCVGDVPFSKSFFSVMKKNNPHLKTHLFLWDKLDVVKVPVEKIAMFDSKFSFDKDDCNLNYGLSYYPDFYIERKAKETNIEYDISYIGSYTSLKRANILNQIYDYCSKNGISSYLYLYRHSNGRTHNLLKILYRKILYDSRNEAILKRYEEKGFLHYSKISLDEVEAIQSKSRVILDISYDGRQGMTLNCIAALAMGKKLLTNNARIKDESFYDERSICIYESSFDVISKTFFKEDISKSINLDFLRLDNWLQFVLS